MAENIFCEIINKSLSIPAIDWDIIFGKKALFKEKDMPQIGLTEIIIVLIIVLLLFGPERISKLGGELGKGIRSFKDGLSGGEKKEDETPKAAGKKK